VPSRSPARYLAPLALALAFIAVMIVVKGSGDGSGGGTTTQTTSRTATTPKARPRKPKQAKTYTVKPGDVLSAIAEQTGVPLDRLLELNEDLDPQELRAGQKIRLRQ